MLTLISRRQLMHLAGSSMLLHGKAGASESSRIPGNLNQLWADFPELDRTTPLAVESLKEWTEDGIECSLVRFVVGVFKGAPSRVAAFYARPQGGTKLPALLEMHGGGQSASLNFVTTYAKRGYAAVSVNWGGNKLFLGREGVYEGPQTDWGKLDATHPPQRNPSNHFAGSLSPDAFTLDDVESPRNSNWFLVLMAGRRAITFLQSRAEVDPARIGACGHSMGGKLTTNLAGIDPRIKAAVPSCGGSGDVSDEQAAAMGIPPGKRTALEMACVSDNTYIPRITCPVLWLSPTNDFHAHIDTMAWNWKDLPDQQVRFSISPHFNHRHTDAHALTQWLWFDQHLKGTGFRMPASPTLTLQVNAEGVPVLSATPDASLPVQRVNLYYSIDPHELTRFWRDARAESSGRDWKGLAPVPSLDTPLVAYADVVYATPESYRKGAQPAGHDTSDTFVISSRVRVLSPSQVRAAGVRATDRAERLIDDGARGWHDWYTLNWGHPPLWSAHTRKLKDPKWRGPDGASLKLEIQSDTDNTLVLTFNTNAWGAMKANAPAVDYVAVRDLKGSPEWQTVSVSLGDLISADPKHAAPLDSWQTVTEFSVSPSGATVRDGQKFKVDGKPWNGPRAIRNLRWEGGKEARDAPVGKPLDPAEHAKQFNEAIRKSLEQEKLDAK